MKKLLEVLERTISDSASIADAQVYIAVNDSDTHFGEVFRVAARFEQIVPWRLLRDIDQHLVGQFHKGTSPDDRGQHGFVVRRDLAASDELVTGNVQSHRSGAVLFGTRELIIPQDSRVPVSVQG